MDTAVIQKQKTIEEIQRMTGSVKMLSEKQIGRMDEQFVQQQLAFETTQERRKNFMEGRGLTVGRAFTKANARVINQEPVLKRGDTKSQRKLNKNATRMFQARASQLDAERQELRDAYAQNEETSFIHARAFASPYQYETLTKAKQWMTDNPGRYAANQKAVDAIYRDLYAASEVYGTYTAKALTYDSLQYDLQDQVRAGQMDRKTAREMQREYDRRAAVEETRQRLVERRLSLLSNALEMLLRGKEYPDMVKEVVRQYAPMDFTTSERDEMRRHAGGARNFEDESREALKPTLKKLINGYYNGGITTEKSLEEMSEKLLRDEKDGLYLLYRAGDDAWNAQLAEQIFKRQYDNMSGAYTSAAHPYVMDYYDRTLGQIDVGPYLSMSDEQLMEHATEFEKMGAAAEAVQSMEREFVRAETGGVMRTQDLYKEKNGLQGDKVFKKNALLAQIAKKARLLWYVEAHKMGVLSADVVSRADQAGGITGEPGAMLAAVQKELARCNALIESGKKSYLQDPR